MARGQHTIVFPTGDASLAGRRIIVAATTNIGADTLHTTSSEATGGEYRYIDFITVTAHNTDTVQRSISLLFGGTTEPDDLIHVDLPAGLPDAVLIEAQPLTGGLALKAYASAASVINVSVRVDRFQQA